MIGVDDLFDDELPQDIDDSETTYYTYENNQNCCNSILSFIYSSSKHLFIVFVISFSLVPVDSDFASSNAITAFTGIMFPKVQQDQYH